MAVWSGACSLWPHVFRTPGRATCGALWRDWQQRWCFVRKGPKSRLRPLQRNRRKKWKRQKLSGSCLPTRKRQRIKTKMNYRSNKVLAGHLAMLTANVAWGLMSPMLPLITMLIAFFYLKEPITWKKMLGIAIGGAGAVIIIVNSQLNAGVYLVNQSKAREAGQG